MFNTTNRWGGQVAYYIMQDDAYDAFNFDIETNYKDAASLTVQSMLSMQRSILPQPQNINGLTLERYWTFQNGVSIPVYSYRAMFNDRSTGAVTRFVPDGWVLGITAPSDGIKAYGRIKHPRANYQAMPRFINRWMDEKSAVNEFEVHTSFLMGHKRINAMTAWKVV